jgi:hypothetical protein
LVIAWFCGTLDWWISCDKMAALRTDKEIRFRFGSSEDKAGKEAKRRPTGW